MQKKKTILILLASVFFAAFAFIGAWQPVAAQTSDEGQTTDNTQTSAEGQTVWQVIQANEQLSDFQTLIEAAGLVDNLQQDGPFTVFAPTNDALATLNAMANNSPASVTDILLYHIVNGRYNATSLNTRTSLTTLLGDSINVDAADGQINLNSDTGISTTDIQATNGVIHIVDTVLLPPANSLNTATSGSRTNTLAQVLADDGRFTTFLSLLDQADINVDLSDPNQTYTVFAPTDAAFDRLTDQQREDYLNDSDTLNAILSYHIVGDRLGINQIATDDYIPTIEGRPLFVTTDPDSLEVFINGDPLESFNMVASNGVVHAVSQVLTP